MEDTDTTPEPQEANAAGGDAPDETPAAPAINPNLVLWVRYGDAFDYFNQTLFKGKLPNCILSFGAQGRSLGYFRRSVWVRNTGEDNLHEISLNPNLLSRGDDLILEMLVRCMVSLWEYTYGEPSSNERYCSTQFTSMMELIGLPCEAPCGNNVQHKVDETGRYAAIRPDAMSHFFPLTTQVQYKKTSKTRIKYECPTCSFTAMASPGGKLVYYTEECGAEMVKNIESE